MRHVEGCLAALTTSIVHHQPRWLLARVAVTRSPTRSEAEAVAATSQHLGANLPHMWVHGGGGDVGDVAVGRESAGEKGVGG